MSQQATIPLVFDEPEFWYKIDVDYEEARELVQTEEDEEGSTSEGDPQSETDGQEEDSEGPELFEGALLEVFIRRKKRVIEDKHDSISEFKQRVLTAGDDDARRLLNEVYVEYIWIQNQEGEVFESDADHLTELDLVDEEENLVQETINNEFDLLWPGQPTIGKEVDDGKIVARRYLQTKPVVVRKYEESFEVRGRQSDRKKVVTRLRSDDDLQERQPEPAEEAIVGKVENLLVEDNEEFRVVGVDFAESELPENSRLRVKNERSIYRDIHSLRNENLVSFDGISEVNKLYLKDIRYGGKFRVELTHGVDGVEFELKTNHKLDEQRSRFKQGFTAVTGIEFEKIYEYGSQDEEYLFNRILAERGTAYENYYEELSEEVQEVLEGNVDATGNALISTEVEEFKTCSHCSEKNSASESECGECGAEDFSESVEETVVEVNSTSVATYIQNRLDDISPTHPNRDFSGWDVGDREMANRKIVQTSFSLTDSEGRRTTSSYQEVDVVPHGNHPRPGTVNDYLLQCVYVTYGQSASADDEGYGRLPLYDIITADNLDALVGNALHNAIVGVKDRLISKASEAHEEASEYYGLVDELGAMHENKDELEEVYDPSNDSYFEKHLFYLLKRLYSQTERWGRIGAREADGVLIVPEEDPSDYYVATYDAKLSHREDGYDLGSEEEDQATRYILTEDEREAIENKTGDNGLSAHLLISQNFDEDDFSRIAGHVQENILAYTDGEAPDQKLVFMEFRAVVELYELLNEYWWALRDARIRGKFDSYVVDELNDDQTEDGESYVHFDSDSVANVRENLIGRLDRYDRDQLEYYPE